MKKFLKCFKSNKYGKDFLIFLLFALGVNILYRSLYQTYFQQDEWYFFGQAIYGMNHGFSNLLGVLGGYHFTPLSYLAYYLEYSILGLNSFWFAFVSIQLHVLTTILVYLLSRQLLRNRMIAFVASLIFAVAYAPSQAVTWFAAYLGEYSTIFGLISIILWLKSYQSKDKLLKTVSLIFLLLGLLFKEDIITLFLIIPILSFYRFGKRSLTKDYLFMLVLGIIYLIPRFLLQHSASSAIQINNLNSLNNFLYISFLNTRVFLTGIGYLIFSPSLIITFLKIVVFELFLSKLTAGFVTVSDTSINTFFTPIAAFLFSTFFVIPFLFLLKRNNKQFPVKRELLLLPIIPLSFAPYIILGRDIILPESRYFYFPMVFMSILLALFIYLFYTSFKNNIVKFFVLFFTIFYLVLNVHYDSFIENYVPLSRIRMNIVNYMNNQIPKKQNKIVFYIGGDNLPFQSGVGQMLVVMTSQKDKRFNDYLKGYFLWNMGSQGYEELGNLGFGYFSDYNELQKAFINNKLNSEDVFAYSWNARSSQMDNITGTIRKKLGNEK